MARSKRNRKRTRNTIKRRIQRDIIHDPIPSRVLNPFSLLQVEDRRKPYDRTPKTVTGNRARIISTNRTKSGRKYRRNTPDHFAFFNPLRVVACKRRKKRRKTLFALRKIGRGRGSGGFKKRIMTELSKVRC